MSRFDELHKAYSDAKKAFFARRDASIAFAEVLRAELERYLGCPMSALRFLPKTGASGLAAASAAEAVWLDAQDTWRFSMGIDLSDVKESARKEAAKQTAVLEVIIQPNGDAFTVGLAGWEDRFTLPSKGGSPEHAAFCEFAFRRLVSSYEQSGQRFFESAIDSKRQVRG